MCFFLVERVFDIFEIYIIIIVFKLNHVTNNLEWNWLFVFDVNIGQHLLSYINKRKNIQNMTN